MILFKMLAKMKGLRGTAFDLFGYQADRRMERRLIEDYRALIASIADKLSETNLSAAIEMARAASDVRGYGPVKAASAKAYAAKLPALRLAFDKASTLAPQVPA